MSRQNHLMEGFELYGPYAQKIFSIDPSPREPKTHENNFNLLHKKKGLFFSRNIEASKAFRAEQGEERRKEKRNQIVMDNRPLNYLLPPTASSSKVKDSRKEQLSRWKLEKDAMKANNLVNKKLPFKGPAAVAQPFPFVSLPPVGGPQSLARRVNSRPELPNNETVKDDIERRITRAMTKSQVSVKSTYKNTMGSTTNKLQNLKITGKPGAVNQEPLSSAKSKKQVTSPQPGTSTKNCVAPPRKIPLFKGKFESLQAEPWKPSGETEHINSASTSSSSSAKTNEIVVAPEKLELEPKTKVKKPKGMQFDAKYVEYNESFIKAGKLLQSYSAKWNSTLNSKNDIPEEVIGQISSAIGQAKLLLDSKLPQFAQLLYHYLSRHQEHGPVLSCDLEGWWDVAVISVEKVKQIFEKLAVLEANGWEEQNKQQTIKPKRTIPPVCKKLAGDLMNRSPKLKPKATSGLLAFLKQKRQQNGAEGLVEENTVGNKTPEREFEGGFFGVCTPIRKPCSPSSVVNSNSRRVLRSSLTPSHRQSQSQVSLRMLAVRKSMGSICKIGVVDIAPQTNNVLEGLQGADSYKPKLYFPSSREKLVQFLSKPTKYPYYLQPNVEYFVQTYVSYCCWVRRYC